MYDATTGVIPPVGRGGKQRRSAEMGNQPRSSLLPGCSILCQAFEAFEAAGRGG